MRMWVVVSIFVLLAFCCFSPDSYAENAIEKNVTQGALRIKTEGGIVECPLKHTDVKAEISGFIARVKVTQTFHNPLDEKIEAVYVFPLPHKSAVDDMTMVIGKRRIVGVIKRRAQAREIYEEALRRGLTASLLEQERPNIFTQSVGNIKPREEVRIEISYVDVLEYDLGTYSFHFPMVVGPRFIPGTPTSKIPEVPKELKGKVGELDKTEVKEGEKKPTGTGWAPDTNRVPDASRITPPVLKPGQRNGHDISLSVRLNAGVPVRNVRSINHKAEIERLGKAGAVAVLSPGDSVPNKDFVLKYGVMGKKPEMAVLCHCPESGEGYFMLMVQPREDERLKKMPPREISFLIDVSGSMSGAPTAKVKEAMKGMLKLCKKNDTLQVITFAGSAHNLFDRPVPATAGNIEKAIGFTRGIRGGGGTRMLKGIKAAINDPLDEERVRIVILLTDGFIGNEAEIIAEVGRRCGDRIRFWCIGIGTSVNRFLVEGVAKQGGGMGKILALNENADALVSEIMFRIHRAQLAKVKIDWGKLPVWDTYPTRIPELWAGRPVIVFGRYEAPGGGEHTITVSGSAEGEPVSWPVTIAIPSLEGENAVLSKVWARNSIEDLMQQTYYAGSPEVEEEVTQIALEYRLMSQYTSFVAVDESEARKMTEPARPPRRMLVPVPIPEGTRYEGFFGGKDKECGEVLCCAALAPVSKSEAFYALPRPARAGGRGPMLRRRFGASGPGGTGAKYAKAKRMNYYVPMAETAAATVGMGGGGRGFQGLRDTGILVDEDVVTRGELTLDADWGITQQALHSDAQNIAKSAGEALKRAQALEKEKKLLPARTMYAWAYMLDAAYANLYYGRSCLDVSVADAMEKVEGDLVDVWTKIVPRLVAKLDMVIRDMSVTEALSAVGKAAGFPVTVVPGSLEDACALVNRREMRVSYLDLRGATAARALDWILRPARMTWRVENGKVVSGTAGRIDPRAGWVYDVASIAVPSSKEMEKIKNYQARMNAAKRAADEFIGAVRRSLSLKEGEMVWFAPGRILILADAKTHEAARKLLVDLANPNAALPKDLAGIHNTTAERAQKRKDMVAKIVETREKLAVLESMGEYGLRLLSSAAAGRLDIEALTELQIAWKSPETAAVLKRRGGRILMRTLWAITESARALPKEAELAELAKDARAAAGGAARQAAADPSKNARAGDVYAALYAALAYGDDEDLVKKARTSVRELCRKTNLSHVERVASALLASGSGSGRVELTGAVGKDPRRIVGEDTVLLTALACRRAGGEAWKTFRLEAKNILGRQPLPGSIVVLVNRLGRTGLPAVASR